MLRDKSCDGKERKINRTGLFELGAEIVQEENRRRGEACCEQKKRRLYNLLS